jgi:hypothetical protein
LNICCDNTGVALLNSIFGGELLMKFLVSALMVVLFLQSVSHASPGVKDMSNRLGVGYSDSFSISPLPSVAVKYYPNNDWALSLALGIDTNTLNSGGNSDFGLGGKFYKTIFTESMLNFFMGAGAGLISQGPASGGTGTTSSGFELEGFGGCEFFIPGLENIGFDFLFGVGVTSISSGVRFRTIGESPLKAGMYFYF